MAVTPASTGALRGNFRRTLADLKHLATFGADGRGVTRPAFSDADLAARHWLAKQYWAIGLDATVDGIGNVLGRDPKAERVLVMGSHADTVPRGGWLDGSMGVIFALEAARAWREARPDARVGIEPVAFSDEEGTVDSCIGSRAFCGLWTGPSEPDSRLGRALNAAGLSGIPQHRFDPARHRGYLEAHIEQGPRLEDERVAIGIVEGIVGVRRKRVRFTGRADHAGTTPMRSRRDAGRAMFTFCTALDAAFRRRMPADAVWNMGVASLSPGAANVVPRIAEVIVEYRHLTRKVIDAMTALLEEAAEHSLVPVTIDEIGALEPSVMDTDLMKDLDAAAAAAGAKAMRLASGAGHDAMITATVMPSAMMFVPSIGGRSHDPAENTSDADLERGLHVFVDWTFRVLDHLEARAA